MSVFIESLIQALKLIISFDGEVMSITLLSLKVSGFAVLLATIIGLPLATIISLNRFFAKRLIVNIIHTLMGFPPVVAGLLVYLVLSRNGPMGYLDILYSPAAMVIAQLILAVPIITGVSIAAINSVPKQVKDTVVSLGATKFQLVRKVIIEARTGLITAVIAGFGAAISEVGAIIMVGGNIRFHTRALTTAIVLETRRGNFEMAMALGIILISLAFIVNYLLTWYQSQGVRR